MTEEDETPSPRGRELWRRASVGRPADGGLADRGPCPVLQDLASYADGLMDAPAVERLENHLASCADCLGHLMALRQVEAAPAALVPAGLRTRIIQQSHGVQTTRWLRAGVRLATAAGLIAALGSAGWLGYRAGASLAENRRALSADLANQASFGLSSDLGWRPLEPFPDEIGDEP